MIKNKMENWRWKSFSWARLTMFQALVFFAILCGTISGTLGDTSIRLPRHTNLHTQNAYKNLPNMDNHKPVFKNCASYQPRIDEEQRAGTLVIKVEAEDPDPPERGGTITYSLIMSKSEKLHQNKFEINPVTGEITTIAVIDREEPENIKEKYVTVFAEDNGRPKLDDSCTFKIVIDDVNDNTPLFDRGYYRELIPQDLEVSSKVMKVTATDDDDGDNSKVRYRLLPAIITEDNNYFTINENSGEVILKQRIDKDIGYIFKRSVMAYDKGNPPRNDTVEITIEIVESYKKPPSFIEFPMEPVKIKENILEIAKPIAQVRAVSNIAENNKLIYSIVAGKTEQTNSGNTFAIKNANNGTAFIIINSNELNYEHVKEYNLTIRIVNWYNLAAETIITIQLEDVNDNPPIFDNIRKTWSVSENEPPGTKVMQVHATDKDGTLENNQITYKLGNFENIFTIDKHTGEVTTLVELDKEKQSGYQLLVIASDNSPSSLKPVDEPNSADSEFFITVADKNDNPPKFNETVYVAKPILENVNENHRVISVYAIDVDTESEIVYSIIDGNEDDSFYIDGNEIRVKKALDYEKITKYNLTIRAFDGIYDDIATVIIFIENVNDNLPEFEEFDASPQINEEEKVEGCITVVKAYDPDIKDRTVNQNITYEIVKLDQKPYFAIDSSGCLTLIKKLNRDPPNGFPTWYVSIAAYDNCGSYNSHHKVTSVNITLNDINDNAPFLHMHQPVVWNENQRPNKIVTLVANDFDSDENGPPFTYSIDDKLSDDEILERFSIDNGNLFANVEFDREERKSYDIHIKITDSGTPTMTGTSVLTVVIGDENDNIMKSGSSSIFVYNYEENNAITDVGRVYVDDPDDWDLPDKQFRWLHEPHENFDLDQNTGMIMMRPGKLEGKFLLEFLVTEESPNGSLTKVTANVTITVKSIPKEAVEKSGSIRFYGMSAEDFITVNSDGKSKRDKLQEYLSNWFNTSINNVDVFTVLHSPVQKYNKSILDVRFSAHGSPYYFPEKLNKITTDHYEDIEMKLGTKIMMINIDECLIENKLSKCNDSCQNHLNIDNLHGVFTNKTSFVGVKAIVEPLCICPAEKSLFCLNGGTPVDNKCECQPGFDGPSCELLDISFMGNGYALMPPPKQTCGLSHLSLEILTSANNGLIFYFGPIKFMKILGIRDFMSLELKDGYAVVYADYGSQTIELKQKTIKLNDGKQHKIDIYWQKSLIQMKIDNCDQSHCWSFARIDKLAELNVNGPIQIGGSISNFRQLKSETGWDYSPSNNGFAGCIRNLTINNEIYNFQSISVKRNLRSGCNYGMSKAVSFGIDSNFIIAIIVCPLILLILLFAVVILRRKRDDLYKDMDDIRENIINYEDEGGGEVDTGYDLNVLRSIYDPPSIDSKIPENYQGKTQDEIPDICSFLDGKKDSCDKDPDTNPFDDVRHYAYEGEGNSDGSLSSLASCTDDGDLKFNYLSNFGPRFRKLADMYGEEPSDDDSDGVEERESESWC